VVCAAVGLGGGVGTTAGVEAGARAAGLGAGAAGAEGTVGINDALSVSRADYIASELNKRGLPSDRITKTGEGGISDYLPMEANRHSKVELFFDKLEKTEIHP
jgi:hypothetical protein